MASVGKKIEDGASIRKVCIIGQAPFGTYSFNEDEIENLKSSKGYFLIAAEAKKE